jgi:outer membrane lipoprotein-sorting protein
MNRYPLILALAALLVPSVCAQTQTPAKPAQKAASVAPVHNPLNDFKQFSAVMSGGPMRQDAMDVSRSGSLLRLGSPEFHYITDLDATITWTITPDKCTKLPVAQIGTLPFHPFTKFDITLAATNDPETIDGHPCKVKTLNLKPKEGGAGFEMKVWQADDLKGFPIRIDWHNLSTQHTSTYTFTDVNLQPPDPKLFNRPADCKSPKGGAFIDTGTANLVTKPPANPAPPSDKPAPPPPQ